MVTIAVPIKILHPRYRNSVYWYEFGHGVKIAGIDRMENDELLART